MEFDREGEFDKVMEEIFPVSIPSNFVKSISVKLANGQQVILKGDELINPLPLEQHIHIGIEDLAHNVIL